MSFLNCIVSDVILTSSIPYSSNGESIPSNILNKVVNPTMVKTLNDAAIDQCDDYDNFTKYGP